MRCNMYLSMSFPTFLDHYHYIASCTKAARDIVASCTKEAYDIVSTFTKAARNTVATCTIVARDDLEKLFLENVSRRILGMNIILDSFKDLRCLSYLYPHLFTL